MNSNNKSSMRVFVVALVVAAVLLGTVAVTAFAVGIPAAQTLLARNSGSAAGTAVQTTAPANTTLVSNVMPQQPAQPDLQQAETLVAAQETVLNHIYQSVLPSVVHIEVTQVVSSSSMGGLQFGLPGFPFGNQYQQNPQQYYQRGEGSGFVWDAQGHILTNNHVVENADQVTVIFADGTQVDAQVLGTDPNSDLAILQVNAPAKELVPIQLADSDQLMVGQMAVAIGNPFGLENTMTSGIVSALGRTIASGLSQFSIPEVIQTDAPINPGNSGGPLLDREGRVIGINTQIVSNSGSNSGIGFAVPINIAKRVAPSLIKNGSYDYAWLGISGQTLSPAVAQKMNLPTDTKGALIISVASGSPADEAGLKGSDQTVTVEGVDYPIGGDVITAIDGTTITSMDDLIAYLTDNARPGDSVTLTVIHSNGNQASVQVTLVSRPASLQTSQATGSQQP